MSKGKTITKPEVRNVPGKKMAVERGTEGMHLRGVYEVEFT